MLGARASHDHEDDGPAIPSGRVIDPKLWTVFRASRGIYVYARPGEKRPGKFICQCVDKPAAQRACRNLARDDRYAKSKPSLSPDNDSANRPKAGPVAGPLLQFFRCGHPRSSENTYRSGKSRKCRQCQIARAKQRYRDSR